jgi:hypothetical protein
VGVLEASDARQTGRHSRIVPVSACGTTKTSPGTGADPSNSHLFDVYRFSNPSSAAACFEFTVTTGVVGGEEAADAGPDASSPDDGADGGLAAEDGGAESPSVNPAPAVYMAAYRTFFPTNIGLEYRGDVGNLLVSPQSMGITVPAGETIDVVVYAVDVAPGGVGSYTLSCSAQ